MLLLLYSFKPTASIFFRKACSMCIQMLAYNSPGANTWLNFASKLEVRSEVMACHHSGGVHVPQGDTDSIRRSLAEHLPKEGKALLFGSQA